MSLRVTVISLSDLAIPRDYLDYRQVRVLMTDEITLPKLPTVLRNTSRYDEEAGVTQR